MKLFRHYKNKPYRFVGTAKHSETLEDMVIYESLYDNPLARIWVRPKEMFYENVTIGGELRPRFAKVDVEIESVTEFSAECVAGVASLAERIFGSWDAEDFAARLRTSDRAHLAIARLAGRIVGFKLGYGQDKDCFYSWIGAVDPDLRGLGLARALMEAQHEWCRGAAFKKVLTKTQNCFREMLLLNIKAGFDVIGIQSSESGVTKILLEKKL